MRFGVLLAAAVVLPSTGYLLGFTKGQTPTDEDWSNEIVVDHDRLSPTLAGIAALHHGDELKLTDAERTAILKIVRRDAPGLLAEQKKEWDTDLALARRVFSGDEIILEFRGLFSLRQSEDRPYYKLVIRHLMDVSRAMSKEKWTALRKKTQLSFEGNRVDRLFLALDPANAETLRLSARQKKQFGRLASYFVSLMDKKVYGSDKPFDSVPIDKALKKLKGADVGQLMVWSHEAEDFLDPIQRMQLRALAHERTYVPVP